MFNTQSRHRFNQIEGVALLSSDHSIVNLDTDEDDLIEARGAVDEINRLQQFLYSDASVAMEESMKKNLEDYLETKKRTISQKHVMDAINITTKGVAKDVVRKITLDQQQAEVQHLLKSIIDTPMVESRDTPMVKSRPRDLNITRQVCELPVTDNKDGEVMAFEKPIEGSSISAHRETIAAE